MIHSAPTSPPIATTARASSERGMMSIVGVVSLQFVRVCRPVGLGVGLLLALASAPAGALAPTSPPANATAPAAQAKRLRVKVAPAIVDANVIPGWIADRNPRLDEQVPTLAGHEQWIAVEINGDTYDYRVVVNAMRDGAPVGPAAEVARCECNTEKLLDLVDERIAAAVERLRSTPLEEPPPEPQAEPEPEPVTTPSAPPPERRPISGLGIGGIATAVASAGLLGGGIAMVVAEPKNVPDFYSRERTWKPPGIAALAVGGAALAAGVSMLVVDVIQCRKADAPTRCERRGRDANQPTLDVGAAAGANGGGLTVFGRF